MSEKEYILKYLRIGFVVKVYEEQDDSWTGARVVSVRDARREYKVNTNVVKGMVNRGELKFSHADNSIGVLTYTLP